jgi:hypothetical protein
MCTDLYRGHDLRKSNELRENMETIIDVHETVLWQVDLAQKMSSNKE